MSSEDYLDSLLKAMEASESPDSAINKVREIEARNAEEETKAKEALETPPVVELPVEEISVTEETPATEEPLVTENVSLMEDTSIIEETPVAEDISVAEAEEPLTVEDIPATEENLVVEEVPSVEEVPVVDEVPAVEEVPSVDEVPAAEDIPEAGEAPLEEVSAPEEVSVNEEISIDEEAIAVENNAVSDDLSVLEPSEAGDVDLSSLLSSDGDATPAEGTAEAEAPVKDENASLSPEDISKLFEDAEAFANSEEKSSEEAPSVENPSEDTPLEDNLLEESEASLLEEPQTEGAADDVVSSDLGDLDSLLAGLSEPSEAEKLADAAEETVNLSADEIDKILADNEKIEPEQQGEVAIDASDLDALSSLGIYDKNDVSGGTIEPGTDEGLDEISSLLKTLDGNEAPATDENDEMLNLLNEAVSEQESKEAEEAAYAENAERESAKEKAKAEEGKKAKKKKKKRKSEDTEEGETPKKENAFTKLFAFLTQEEEEEAEEPDLLKPADAPTAEGENAEKTENFEDVKGENKEILDELDAEGEDGKKKKKGKKGKKDKKGKKGKTAEVSEEGEEGDEGEGGEAKPKKAKKERAPLILDIDTGKPLSKKNVRLIFIMAASLLVVIALIVLLIPGMILKGQARKAYYKGDYKTTYNLLYDEKLNDSDQIMFDRSEIILKISHKLDAFSAYNRMGMKVEALDQLLQGVANYESWLLEAEVCGAENTYLEVYQKVLNALLVSYNLSEQEAKAINALPTNLEYSLMCESIVNKTEYIDPTLPLPGPFIPPVEVPEYQDVLPEEGL